MSRIIHLVNMALRYLGSKAVCEYRQDDGCLGNPAAPCHLEQSVSHSNSRDGANTMSNLDT